MTSKALRFEEVDFFRFLVVSFALLNHCFLFIGSEAANETGYATFRRIFSYPSVLALLFVFGMMAQIVYVKRYSKNRYDFFVSIGVRAAYCIFGVWILSFLDFVFHNASLTDTLRRMTLTLPPPLVSIFSLYFFLLLLLSAIVPLRLKFGPWTLVGIVVAIQFYTLLLAPILPPAPPPFGFLGAFFLGLGEFGPSLLHALTPMFAGMLFAGGFLMREPSRADRLALAALVVGGLIFLARVAWLEGLPTLLYNLTDYSKYRPDNMPEFFAWGIVFSLLTYVVAKYAIEQERLGFLKRLNFLGGATFAYFLLGNIVIFELHANGMDALNEPALTLVSLGVLALSGVLTAGWVRFGRATALWREFERQLTAMLTWMVSLLPRRRAHS